MMVFPTLKKVGECAIADGGLTKRELFAAMCLQGLLADPTSTDAGDDPSIGNDPKKFRRALARSAVTWADCLIEALNQPCAQPKDTNR